MQITFFNRLVSLFNGLNPGANKPLPQLRVPVDGNDRAHQIVLILRAIVTDLRIVEEAYSLPEPFHADPVDRVLVATARLHNLQLVTGDRKILDYPHVQTLW